MRHTYLRSSANAHRAHLGCGSVCGMTDGIISKVCIGTLRNPANSLSITAPWTTIQLCKMSPKVSIGGFTYLAPRVLLRCLEVPYKLDLATKAKQTSQTDELMAHSIVVLEVVLKTPLVVECTQA
jgi:hypothetical protein